MIRELGERLESVVLDGVGRSVSRFQERTPLAVDLLESDEAYLAVFDAPGVTAADVDVTFDENEVVVRIDRFREFHDDYEMKLPGRGLALTGSVELPPEAAVEPREASATVTHNGTLQVRIPKSEPTDHVGVTEESEEDEEDDPVTIDTNATDDEE